MAIAMRPKATSTILRMIMVLDFLEDLRKSKIVGVACLSFISFKKRVQQE